MSETLYRKYRSKTLSEIVGQAHITDLLVRSLAQGRIAHAYLLTGPRGVGKTSIARILAHEINGLPYDEAHTHLDIIEIDAASNNGVEDVRDLREKVQIAPVSATKKIYIIDEVHMLSKAAFNALLKTLEEPPEHAVFILATTDANKLPATIISRTQRFSFRAIAPADAIKHLKHIAKEEKIKVNEEALALITTRGDGSFRDSISLLDQLRSLADKKQGITRELVEQSLGLAPAEHVDKLLAAYEAKDLKTIVALLDESEQSGVQSNILASQLIQTIRAAIVEKPYLMPLLDHLLDIAKSSQPRIKLLTILASHPAPKPKSVALSTSLPEISAPIAELEKQAIKTKPASPFSSNPASLTPVPSKQISSRPADSPSASLSAAELAMLKQSSLSKEASRGSAGSLDNVSSGAGVNESAGDSTPARQQSSRSTISSTKYLQPEPESNATSGPDISPGAKPFDRTNGGKGDQESENSEQKETTIDFDWNNLIQYTREHFVAIYSVLSKCTPHHEGTTLILYTANNFYKKKLDDSKYRASLSKSLQAIGSGDLIIQTIGTPPPPKDSLAIAVAAIMGGGEEVKVDT